MIELFFIPIIWILIIIDILFTGHSLKEAKKKIKTKKFNVEDMELNPLAKFIIKKLGIKNFKYIMIPFSIILMTSLLIYGWYQSNETYFMGVGFFIGAYFIVIRIHINNYYFLKKYNKTTK
jgi:hypothetical protein